MKLGSGRQKDRTMKTPRLILISFLIVVAVGRSMPMTVMLEPGDPWYLSYTSIWFLAAAFLLYPSNMLSLALGLSVEGIPGLFLNLAWLAALALIIYHIPFPKPLEERGGS
jgi:hypothetical protein